MGTRTAVPATAERMPASGKSAGASLLTAAGIEKSCRWGTGPTRREHQLLRRVDWNCIRAG